MEIAEFGRFYSHCLPIRVCALFFFYLSAPSPVPDLEMLLEVSLHFQVRLTIILGCGSFSRANGSRSSILKYNGSNPSLLKILLSLIDKSI